MLGLWLMPEVRSRTRMSNRGRAGVCKKSGCRLPVTDGCNRAREGLQPKQIVGGGGRHVVSAGALSGCPIGLQQNPTWIHLRRRNSELGCMCFGQIVVTKWREHHMRILCFLYRSCVVVCCNEINSFYAQPLIPLVCECYKILEKLHMISWSLTQLINQINHFKHKSSKVLMLR